MGALNPRQTIYEIVAEALRIHRITKGPNGETEEELVAKALSRAGLRPPQRFYLLYPHELSGGQRQRVVIAGALVLEPEVIVADEPVSNLDASVRGEILRLLMKLREEDRISIIIVTHDLGLAWTVADRVAVMYLGRIVEIGPSEAIYEDPKHPYTQALLRAIPEPDPRRTVPRDLPRGEVPDAARPPLGCSFHPRCPRAFEICGWESRDLRDLLEAHWAKMGAHEYEAERAIVGDLDVLSTPATSVKLPTRGGAKGADLLHILEHVRASDPGEPFWKGLRHMHAGEDFVEIEWNEPREPVLVEAGRVQVECHLYG